MAHMTVRRIITYDHNKKILAVIVLLIGASIFFTGQSFAAQRRYHTKKVVHQGGAGNVAHYKKDVDTRREVRATVNKKHKQVHEKTGTQHHLTRRHYRHPKYGYVYIDSNNFYGATEVIVDGETYYYKDGVYYKIYYEGTDIIFVVVDDPHRN